MKRYTDEQLMNRRLHHRTIEAVIWGMPAVNYELMYDAMSKDQYNQFVYWSGLLTAKNQTLTPNPDLIYYMAFLNTKKSGPVIVEVPPSDQYSLNGNICDCWQAPLEDVGLFGADKGKGGKYLILPPDYKGEVPDGYIVLRSYTFNTYCLFRIVLKKDTQEELDKGLEYAHQCKIYPLAQADNPPKTVRKDLQGQLIDSKIKYDIRFFEALHKVVQEEPWIPRDKAFIEILADIGIEKGKKFEPNNKSKKIMEEAIAEAHDWIRSFYENHMNPFYKGSQWFFPSGPDFIHEQESYYTNPNIYPYTLRGVPYFMGFIGLKHLGAGQFYLINIRDKDGNILDSSQTYRLKVPADVPVTQYWSTALYDGDTHTFVADQNKFSCSSQSDELIFNEDGSVYIYFGRKAPEGLEANWIDSGQSKNFEALFRFYGTEKAIFDQSWHLEDLELID